MLLTAAVAELATLPLAQFREVPPAVAGVPPACDAAARRGRRVPLLVRALRLPAARVLHVELDRALAAARQRLQRPHPGRLSQERRSAVVVSVARVVRHPGSAGARYVVFHLDMYNARARERLFERLDTYSPYLRPLAQEGSVWLYEIVGWPN